MYFICFGEAMLRLVPAWRGERLLNAGLLRVTPGGSELNVAACLSALGPGHNVTFLSALPKNCLGTRILMDISSRGIRYAGIASSSDKIGTYWVEPGSGVRPSEVIYDRYNSAFDRLEVDAVQKADLRCDWFHSSGITLGISKRTNEALFRCLRLLPGSAAFSLDLNYRKKLWQWTGAGRMRKIYEKAVSRAVLLGGNEYDYRDCLGMRFSGKGVPENYSAAARRLFLRNGKLRFIAVSLRESNSATLNAWSGLLFVKTGKSFDTYIGKKITLDNIVDRLGTGDSFLAGIIFGLNSFGKNYRKTLDFAVMLSALNHTTFGDFSTFSAADVFGALDSSGSGRINR